MLFFITASEHIQELRKQVDSLVTEFKRRRPDAIVTITDLNAQKAIKVEIKITLAGRDHFSESFSQFYMQLSFMPNVRDCELVSSWTANTEVIEFELS